MDDKNFDDLTAQQWIDGIEAAKKSTRDYDVYPIISKWIQIENFKKILDVGCGQGVCSDNIDLSGRSYTGLEPSPLLFARAQELYQSENRQFVQGNIYNLPFADNAFDGVFSLLVWHLLENLEAAAQQLSRVLTPDGHFLIITANPESYAAWKSSYKEFQLNGKCLQGTREMPDGQILADTLYLHEQTEILESLEKESLKVTHIRTFRPAVDGTHLFLCLRGSKIK